jgi:hypothetical protein
MKCIRCKKEVGAALAIRYDNEPSDICYYVCFPCVADKNMLWPDWEYLEWLAKGNEDEWVSPGQIKGMARQKIVKERKKKGEGK